MRRELLVLQQKLKSQAGLAEQLEQAERKLQTAMQQVRKVSRGGELPRMGRIMVLPCLNRSGVAMQLQHERDAAREELDLSRQPFSKRWRASSPSYPQVRWCCLHMVPPRCGTSWASRTTLATSTGCRQGRPPPWAPAAH